VNRNTSLDNTDSESARLKAAATAHAARAASKQLVAPAARLDATWQASSFDLAQGLEVKVMHSKLSQETLDRLFRG
jgi:hypothetical protein